MRLKGWFESLLAYRLTCWCDLPTRSSCAENLTIFQTREDLYQFNAGWFYNSEVNISQRKQIDRELIGLRINGTVSRQVVIDCELEVAVPSTIADQIRMFRHTVERVD